MRKYSKPRLIKRINKLKTSKQKEEKQIFLKERGSLTMQKNKNKNRNQRKKKRKQMKSKRKEVSMILMMRMNMILGI